MPPLNARRPTGTACAIAVTTLFVSAAYAGVDSCPADLNGDSIVDGNDLGSLLGQWGACPACAADFNGDNVVDGNDLGTLLGQWGNCPVVSNPRPMELAGRALAAFPWFEFVNNVNPGTNAVIMVDTIRMPDLIGANASLFVVNAKTAAQWAGDQSLTDARGAPQAVSFVAGGAPANTITVTNSSTLSSSDGERFGRGYDLVIDLNGNGVLDGNDIIDGLSDIPGFTVLPNATLNGPYAVTTVANYTASGITSASHTLSRLWYPSNIAALSVRPIVVISHGNGHNYTWYDYLGTHLASWGFVVISHQNNTVPGIETSSTTTLEHTAALINQQATIAGGVLNGRINANDIYWIGHSRGGEGITRAYDRLFDNTYVPASGAYNVNSIKLLIPIAPTDFLGKGGVGSGSDPHGVPFMLLYGSADGDVCGCPGNNIADSFNLYERAVGDHWSTYIHGADHNDFNCCGVNDFTGPAGTALGNAEVQKIAKVHILAAIRSVLDGSPAAREMRWRNYNSLRPTGVLAGATVRIEDSPLSSGTLAVIDNFQTQPSTAISSSGGAVAFTVANITEGLSDDINATFTWPASDPFNGQTRNGVGDVNRGTVFDWSGAATKTWSIVPALQDFSGAKTLAFRSAQGTRHPNLTPADSTFQVTLTDGNGQQSTVTVGVYGQGLGFPYQRTGFGTGAGWQNELQSVRLRLDDFRRHGNPIDLTQIATVRFSFADVGQSATGRLVVDDLSLLSE